MRAILALVLAISVLAGPVRATRQAEKDRKQIDLHLYYKNAGWTMTNPTPDDPKSKSPAFTYSVFGSLVQAVDPVSGEPYDKTIPEPPCQPADLRIRFRLDKREFLLGEPILVEFSVELDGPGHYSWNIGGNYRARGRDDNFKFIMRGSDGSTVPDPYGTEDYFFGGLSGVHDVNYGSPVSQWFAVQRWCVIDQPGTYDLYCSTSSGHRQRPTGEVKARAAALPEEYRREVYVDKNGDLMDVGTGRPSNRYELVEHHETVDQDESPLRDRMPADVAKFFRGSAIAHFKITVTPGTDEENKRMVDHWVKDVEPASGRANMSPAGRQDAALEAIWFARQKLFIPQIARWLAGPESRGDMYLEALAMRSDALGMQLLQRVKPAQAVAAFYRLNSANIPDAIPICIEWLTDLGDSVRADAESLLTKWTGESFDHNWPGYHYQRPTLEEALAMQPRWREWWAQNKDSFIPR
jgi:hypothetical protein